MLNMLVKNMISILLVVKKNPAVSPWSFALGMNCCGADRVSSVDLLETNARSDRRTDSILRPLDIASCAPVAMLHYFKNSDVTQRHPTK